VSFKLDDARKAEIASFIEHRFDEYRTSAFFANWKLLCENIRDAVDMRWRPGEQLTRTGLYVAAMRAARDGFREGFTDTFGQAKPLFVYKPRRKVKQELADRMQEEMSNTWEDIEGLSSWLGQIDDSIDYSMGVSYCSWLKMGAEAEKPVIDTQAWGDAIEWKDEYDILLNQPDIGRIHPFNYACDPRVGENLSWEGCEWEWSYSTIANFLGDPKYDGRAVARLMKKIEDGQIAGGSQSYYNVADKMGGSIPNDKPVFAKEYWGTLRGVKGLERDNHEYVVTVCEGEVIRFNVNKIRGKRAWRPFNRTRLTPLNDIPIGQHILAPMLTSQRSKNLMFNLQGDDILMRQHLGLAVWPNALKNPNDLLNPEGARGVVFMKDGMSPNFMPRFFADGRSGVFQDASQYLEKVDQIEQMAGINHQALGMGGEGGQNQTATGQRFLANVANRRSRSAILWSVETGLKRIGKSVMLLNLRNKPPEDLGISPNDLAEVWGNNYFECSDVVTFDQTQQNMALANWGQVAMQKLGEISPPDGSADHVVEYLKDLGRTMGIPTQRLDSYFKKSMPPVVGAPVSGGQPPSPPPPGALPPPAKAQDASGIASPMTGAEMTEEEMANAMG
jgi:hypothetical protein